MPCGLQPCRWRRFSLACGPSRRNATGPLGGPRLTSGQVRNFPLLSSACAIPASAKAISVNVTLVTPPTPGSVATYPGDAPAPLINTASVGAASEVRASNTILLLALTGDGSANALATFLLNGSAPGTVQFLIDVDGYFQ